MGRDFLDKVKDEVDFRFGVKEEKKARADKVDGGKISNSSSVSGGRKTYKDLPKEARESCDSFAAGLVGPNKTFKTMAEWQAYYVKDYFGE